MTTLTDVLAAHRYGDSVRPALGGDYEVRCWCGIWVTSQDHMAHVATAIADAGLEVVELPAATIVPSGWSDDCLGAWPVDTAQPYIDPVSAWPEGWVADSDGNIMLTERARRMALALLAAARAAEAATS